MNEEEQASQEEPQGNEDQEDTSTETSSTEENSYKGEKDSSLDGENGTTSSDTNGETDSDGDDNEDSDDDNGNNNGDDGSSADSTGYDPDLMLESHNRKLLYNKFVALRDILWDISNMADDLVGKYENTDSSDPTLFTAWKNASYISNTAQEKIEQISSILRSDVITKLEVDKLRKIFLALQRITNSLIDLLERATRKN